MTMIYQKWSVLSSVRPSSISSMVSLLWVIKGRFVTVTGNVCNAKKLCAKYYRPPRVKVKVFCEFLSDMCETFVNDSNLSIFFGDMNCNPLNNRDLCDVCDVFGLKNIIKDPTCFKADIPTLVDVFLTNKPRSFSGAINVDIGSSDFHNFIGVASKMFAPLFLKRKLVYRSMKHFCDKSFQNDLDKVPFHICNIFEDIDDIYWAQNMLFTSVLNEHASLKVKSINKPQVPYMNSELRKAMHNRNMWRGKHFRNKKDKYSRSMYVKWRNKVVKLRKISIQNYFDQRCNTKHNPRDFYKTVCPFLSDKPSSSNGKIILCDDGDIISDPSQVANIFNVYYSSISAYNGIPDGLDSLTFEDAVLRHISHESIALIKQHTAPCENFRFRVVSHETFKCYIDQLKSDKAAGFDGLKAKFLKLSGNKYISFMCDVFNKCVCTNVFPSSMKLAEISPIYKKDDNLCKENYRSVNLLIMVSKVFERILADQLTAYFENLLSSCLSAYRKGYNCQHVILRLTEYWRQALDGGNFVGTVAMDLSKAFDRMPHGLLIAKLHAYGLSINACQLIISYLRDRRQRVKVMGECSDWTTVNRGVPQGSVMGPLLFNIFLNDLFYVKMNCEIANYADDNHLYYAHHCDLALKNTLEVDTNSAIDWFVNNYMDANPHKFQSIVLGGKRETSFSVSVQENLILPTDNIRVLGVTLDDHLKFDAHITNICIAASRQINALKRLSKYLNERSRVLIYKSFISSNFNYCPVTWMFCGRKNVTKLEKLQERALRFVFKDNNSSYADLLKRGNFLSLSAYRIRNLAMEVFKCFHGMNPMYLNNLFCKQEIKYNLRDKTLLEQPKFSTKTYGYRSFKYYGSKLWNALPFEIKNTEDYDED